jgi:hypothetical protein
MADYDHYVREARRCRDLAAASADAYAARRWNKLADDYAALAEQLDARIRYRPARRHLPQQLQQQHSKAK